MYVFFFSNFFNQANLENTLNKKKRHHVSIKRKAFFPQLEEQLIEFINERRKEEAVVTGVTILNKARAIAVELQLTTFGGLCLCATFN